MKKWKLLVLTLLAGFYFTSNAFAAYSSNLDERPTAFESEESIGYFLWQDKDGLHLRITSTGLPHVFSGTIRTDGRFENILGKYLGNHDDYFDVSKSENKITYHFITAQQEKGIDLQLSYGSYMKFSLDFDGDPIDSEKIFIGKDGWHPARNEFTLQQDEDYSKYIDQGNIYIIGGGFWRAGGHGPKPHG